MSHWTVLAEMWAVASRLSYQCYPVEIWIPQKQNWRILLSPPCGDLHNFSVFICKLVKFVFNSVCTTALHGVKKRSIEPVIHFVLEHESCKWHRFSCMGETNFRHHHVGCNAFDHGGWAKLRVQLEHVLVGIELMKIGLHSCHEEVKGLFGRECARCLWVPLCNRRAPSVYNQTQGPPGPCCENDRSYRYIFWGSVTVQKDFCNDFLFYPKNQWITMDTPKWWALEKAISPLNRIAILDTLWVSRSHSWLEIWPLNGCFWFP